MFRQERYGGVGDMHVGTVVRVRCDYEGLTYLQNHVLFKGKVDCHASWRLSGVGSSGEVGDTGSVLSSSWRRDYIIESV